MSQKHGGAVMLDSSETQAIFGCLIILLKYSLWKRRALELQGRAHMAEPLGDSARSFMANIGMASPAKMAVASSVWRCRVGRPRRRSSSSKAGRSSCTKLNAWIISTAAAGDSASSSPPPMHWLARRTSAGRSRLPGASTAYSMAAASSGSQRLRSNARAKRASHASRWACSTVDTTPS